jgi:hypothetical protein
LRRRGLGCARRGGRRLSRLSQGARRVDQSACSIWGGQWELAIPREGPPHGRLTGPLPRRRARRAPHAPPPSSTSQPPSPCLAAARERPPRSL